MGVKLQLSVLELPRTMKLPVVRYSPVGAVLETYSVINITVIYSLTVTELWSKIIDFTYVSETVTMKVEVKLCDREVKLKLFC